MSIPYMAVGIIIFGLSYGLISGVFLAFSDFIMKSLAVIDPFSGARSMQEINRNVYGSFFLTLLVIMSVTSFCIVLYAYLMLSGLLAFWLICGGAVYFIGVLLVTILGNVPMNQHLDAMDPSLMATQQYWKVYIRDWTRLNHIRTLASSLSCASFFMACLSITSFE